MSKKQAGFKNSVNNLFHQEKLTKMALREFNLEIAEGEFVGLIGPNGAGKTTIMKLLSGIIRSSNGIIAVFGRSPSINDNNFKKKFSLIMGQKSQLWWDLPAVDSFLLNKEIYQVSDNNYYERLDYFKEVFKVVDLLDVPVRKLSLGERMRMEIIACLLHNPQLLLMDEPTIGLDAIAQKSIRAFLKRINKDKHITIILTSHYMEDIRALCNRVVVVNDGRKVFDGDYNVLTSKYNETKTITFTHNGDIDFDLPSVEAIRHEAYSTTVRVKKENLQSCLSFILRNYEISDMLIHEEEIADIIEKIYRETADDKR